MSALASVLGGIHNSIRDSLPKLHDKHEAATTKIGRMIRAIDADAISRLTQIISETLVLRMEISDESLTANALLLNADNRCSKEGIVSFVKEVYQRRAELLICQLLRNDFELGTVSSIVTRGHRYTNRAVLDYIHLIEDDSWEDLLSQSMPIDFCVELSVNYEKSEETGGLVMNLREIKGEEKLSEFLIHLRDL